MHRITNPQTQGEIPKIFTFLVQDLLFVTFQSRRHVTTEDLLQQTSVASNDDKIYGFYYLV